MVCGDTDFGLMIETTETLAPSFSLLLLLRRKILHCIQDDKSPKYSPVCVPQNEKQ